MTEDKDNGEGKKPVAVVTKVDLLTHMVKQSKKTPANGSPA